MHRVSPAASATPDCELGACLHTSPHGEVAPTVKDQAGSELGNLCYAGKITCKKGLFQMLDGCGYGCSKNAPIPHLSLGHSTCKCSWGEEAGALKGESAAETDLWT